MSLIDEFMTDCVMLEEYSEPDGEGAQTVVWKEGKSFRAAIRLDSPAVVTAAEKPVLQRICTVTTCLPKQLRFGEVFRRMEDGAVFRVTSDSADSRTPARSGFQIAQCKAERWELT